MRISICRGHILCLQTNIVPCICKHCLYIGVRIIKVTFFFFFFFWSSLYTVYLVKKFLFYSTSHFNLLAWNSIMTFKCCFMNKRWKQNSSYQPNLCLTLLYTDEVCIIFQINNNTLIMANGDEKPSEFFLKFTNAINLTLKYQFWTI